MFPVEIEHRKLTHDRSEPKQLRVLYAGTLGRAQNLTNAVRAVAIAQQDGYDIAIRFVGAGAARQELVRVAKELQVSVEFSSRIAAEDLSEHYDWADTALVHLTNWPALEQAVPSKTYELMSCGIHISAVVSGETKEIVEELGAGHVVAPESPRELASLWESLIDSPAKLTVSDAGATWVEVQRKSVAPEELLRVIRKFESN